MTSRDNLNFSHQDLRNRCFKGLNLQGANFRGADIRGCDFSFALLEGANFAGARMGITLKRVVVLGVVGAIATLLMASAVTRTLFSALGEPLGGRNGGYILALLLSLGIAGTASGSRMAILPQYDGVARSLSGSVSGALLGFFYGGLATNENPQVAIVAAVVGAVLMGLVSLRFHRGIVSVAVVMAAAVMGYGLAFWFWTYAIACLTTQKLVWGIVWSILSLTYIGLTVSSLFLTVKEIKNSARTSFRNADLTNAVFDRVNLKHIDISGTIGYPGRIIGENRP